MKKVKYDKTVHAPTRYFVESAWGTEASRLPLGTNDSMVAL